MGACLVAAREQMGNFEHHHAEWATQLLIFLPDAHTPRDIQDWLGALTPDLCEARPDLLLRLSDHLCKRLPYFPKGDLFECVARCLNMARSAKQSDAVWTRVCAGLPKLQLPAMDELLTCLQGQRDHGPLPKNLERLIAHVQNVIDHLKDLPTRHFSAVVEVPGAATNRGPTLRMASDSNSNGLISQLIDRLIDVGAKATASLRRARGAAQPRLDMVLQALLVGLT